MGKQIILYSVGTIFIILGILLIQLNFKKKTFSDEMRFANYIPLKNYGKPFPFILGLFVLIMGLLLIIKA